MKEKKEVAETGSTTTPSGSNIQQSSIIFKYGSIRKEVEERNVLLSFILENGINFLVGKGGCGKTFLSYHLVLWFLRVGYYVFYVDIDNPSSLLIERGLTDKVLEINKESRIRYYNYVDYIQAFKNKDATTMQAFVYKIMHEIVEYATQNPDIEVVVFVDALQGIIRDFSNEKVSNDFMYLLRRYTETAKVTFVILHHITKDSEIMDPKFKGFTVLRDAGDMMYYIKETHRDDFGNITEYIIRQEKARYLAPEKITVKLEEDYNFDVILDAIEGINNAVVKLAYFILTKEIKLTKTALIGAIQKKITAKVGRAKIGTILDEYVRKGMFIAERGDRKAIYLSINQESELVKKLLSDE